MEWLDGETIFDAYLSNTLHADTQVEDHAVSLTAGNIYRVENPGDLDFGGSEFKLANREAIAPEKRHAEDDYGWWELNEGTVLLELNENITYSGGFTAVLHPHDHLTWNGASHPTLWLSDAEADMRLLLPLHVPESGVNIKENARVTSLRVSN
ncbi:MAG: dCTP deaminase [bacterium]